MIQTFNWRCSNSAASNPNTVDAKRLIGRKFNDKAVQNDLQHFPFKVILKSEKPMIQVTYKNELKTFNPEISSMVLIKMKELLKVFLVMK